MKKLTNELRKAKKFKLPTMTEGTMYLYDNIYQKLLRDEEVRLSQLNFDVFEYEDLTALTDLHTDVFEKNERKAYGIITELSKIEPVHNAVSFV
jgi:hypothetical protein